VRVLQIDSGREWRGGQNQVRLLCRELSRLPDVEQLLVSKRGGELARRVAVARDPRVTVAGVWWTIGPDPLAAWRTARAARAFRPAVLHAHDSHALLVALWARRWTRGAAGNRSPVVATRRVDFPVRAASPWLRADHIIAISAAVRGVLLRGGVPAARISVVPSGIDPDEVRAAAATPAGIRHRLGLAPRTPLALNVAALVDHKDQRTLVRAAAAARTARPDLHWAVAGEGALRRTLEGDIARLGLTDRVHLLGYVEDVAPVIREADVFVMSSKEEGLGSVILDALALGTTVVATAGGGIPEILPAQALVPVGDATALAQKVVAALDHPPAIPLPPRFTSRAMAEGVLAVYHSVS
jgi:glycosyltransferase involved in cell wall biosynthesis